MKMKSVFTLVLFICFAMVSTTNAAKVKKRKRSTPAKKKTHHTSRKGVEVEIPLNIGVGVAMPILPAPLYGFPTLHTGMAFDLYAAIPPEVIKANINKVPKKYRKFVSTDQEMPLKPMVMGLIPTRIYISPKREATDSTEMYGATWSFYGLGINTGASALSFSLSAKLPLVTWAWLRSDILEKDKQLVGVGASLNARIKLKISKTLAFTVGAEEQGFLPVFGMTSIEPKNGIKQDLWNMTVLTAMVHYRIPIRRKI